MEPNDEARNLLFGVLALQAGLVNVSQLTEIISAWAARKDTLLADLLTEQGLLTSDDKALVNALVERNLKKFGGDAPTSVSAICGDRANEALTEVIHSHLPRTLPHLPPWDVPGLVSPQASSPPGRERYSLTRLHAKGGLGQVWVARDEGLGREVALKNIRPERADQPAVRARFLTEAKITGQLEHPSIVPVYELVEPGDGQPPFYTMRLIRGRTLADAIKSYHRGREIGAASPLDPRELLGSLVAVCNAVAYAHSRGVLHRDLKPLNIVLGDFGEVIVLDWGMAKLMGQKDVDTSILPISIAPNDSQAQTVQGQVLGTPAYLSPEQAQGQLNLLDQRSDVYGLGAVLYEILTGQPPFAGQTSLAVIQQVVQDPPVPPRQRVAATPRPLEAVCLKALEKKPANRYQSAKDLAEDIQRWLADEPVSAHAEPWSTTARRWVGRHRTLVTATGAAVLMATVMLAVATLVLRDAREREHRSRTQAESNFRLAREAVDRYFTKVSESPQLKAQGLEPLRRDLLVQAKEFYERFLQEQGDEPGLQAERGNAYLLLAQIHQQMGDRERAEELFGKGLPILEALTQEHPDVSEYQEKLARGHERLGVLYADINRLDRAEAKFRQARDIEERLVQANPDVPEYQRLLAISHNDLGIAAYLAGRMAEAEAAYLRAVPIQEKLVQLRPDSPEYQNTQATIYTNLGNLYGDTGRITESEKAYQKAMTIQEELARQQPDVQEYRYNLASSLHNLAGLYMENSQQERAEQPYLKAMKITEELADRHPTVLGYAAGLAESYTDLGTLYRKSQPQTALTWYDKAIQQWRKVFVREPSHRTGHVGLPIALAGRAEVLAREGQHVEATKEADELAKKKDLTPGNYFTLGCTYALCSQAADKDSALAEPERRNLANQLAARAVEMLIRAVAERSKNDDAIRKDADFDSLRQRDDFKKLVQGLEAKEGKTK